MDIHPLSNEIPPVKIVNRSLLLYKRNSYYYNGKSKPSYKHGKEYCKPSSKIIKNKPYGEKYNYHNYNEKECKAKREKWKKEQARKKRQKDKERRDKERKDKERKDKERKDKERKDKERKDKERKDKEKDKNEDKKKPPLQQPQPPNADPNNNPNNNPYNNPYPPVTSTPPGFMDPTNSAGDSGISPTSTSMPNAVSAALPSEDRPKISVAGISVIVTIFFGIAVLVGLAVYRKRYNLRRGAVRLYDEPDQNDPDTSARPRYLSSISNMRSLRIPSMPPKVQLTRLSSATILLPFRDNYSAPSNNNVNNNYLSPSNINVNNNNYLSPSNINVNNNYLSPSNNNGSNNYLSPSNNNGNNNFLSPYTRVHPQPSSNLSSGSFTISDYQGPDNQKTDSMQSLQSSPSSHESYTSLESSFPIPPQRAVDDYNNTTPTNSTFGDMYKLKII